MMIDPKYNNKSMILLNSINTVTNEFKRDCETCDGRFKHIKLAAKACLVGIKLLAYSISLIVVFIFEKLTQFFIKKFDNRSFPNNDIINKPNSDERGPILNDEILQARFVIPSQALQIREDLSELRDSGKKDLHELIAEIKDFIKSEGLFTDKSPEKVSSYISKAAATYASSRMHYAPVVIGWAHSVLETAKACTNESDALPHRVVFLARDGIPVYEIAKKLIGKHAKYADVPVSLLYISRKVKDWAKTTDVNSQMLVDYAKQEGIQQDQKCIFIDIGFMGSIIDPVKDALRDLTKDIQFGFLVSHTQKAHGLMANLQFKLSSVTSAGQNRAVHWLEDTHQGTTNSPTKLMHDEDGNIVPDFKDSKGNESCKMSHPKSYLYKYFGKKAILDGSEDSQDKTRYLESESNTPRAWEMASEESKNIFDNFLTKYFKGERFSFVKHF